ncbi:MAG: proton-conducting transporter transmembrane domain-containing protein [Sulfuricurvum sp.]
MHNLLFVPPALILLISFFQFTHARKYLTVISFSILIPIVELFLQAKPYHLIGDYLVVTELNGYILLVSSIVSVGVTLALMTLEKHVAITASAIRRFYRFFAIFWIGLIIAILANNMGLYWIGLELATLSTVYMIKTNNTRNAHKQAWNYMLVGTIAISLILFGIILMYASAKPLLGEDAMQIDLLMAHAKEIKLPFLFEIGFAITTVGMFIKMGFFPMNLWLSNIERAAFYPVAALFSGILESAVLIGFFNFSTIAMEVNYAHLIAFVTIYGFVTLFIVAFLIFRSKDFIRLFSSSGVEHAVLITLFWVSGGAFAALLHFGAHAFLKPALFLSTGVLESHGKYKIAGALRGYHGVKGQLFWFLVSLFLLGIISLPPSPMFFSELYGFGAMIKQAHESGNMLNMIGVVLLLLLLLSLIFYRFVAVYQSMKYEGVEEEKTVYGTELFALILFALSALALITPPVMTYLRGIV